MERYRKYQIIETTEALAIICKAHCSDICGKFEPFLLHKADVEYCTKDFVANLNTLIRDMDNVYYLRLSN